ncbi:MAG: Xaa-Pro peptidase family protein [Candidatus Limnocylindrales bacterium]|jgi:Xaa-Pro aminopeptidase
MPEATVELPCQAWFAPDEYQGRVAGIRRRMAEQRIEGLLITSEQNFIYLSGMPTPSFLSRARPLSLILPLESDPVLVVAEAHTRDAVACSWVEDVRGFDGFERESLSVIADALRDRGLDRVSIGCELGEEQRLGISWLGFEALRQSLPDAQFVDAAQILWSARKHKSPTEIAYLKEVGQITGHAYEAALGEVRAGTTEEDVYRRFAARCAELGAKTPGYFAMHSGRGSDTRPNRWPTDRRLQSGDLLWIDAGTAYRGYWSDYTRMLSIGEPDAERQGAYAFVHDTAQQLLASVRPGVACRDLMAICELAFARAGRRIGNSTRIGHGIGLELSEPPSILGDDPTVLEPGMAIALEPAFRGEVGYFVVEEDVVVTDTGFEYLSVPAPAELPAI